MNVSILVVGVAWPAPATALINTIAGNCAQSHFGVFKAMCAPNPFDPHEGFICGAVMISCAGAPVGSSSWEGSPIMVDGSICYHGLAQCNGLLSKPAKSGDSGRLFASLVSAAKCDAEMQAELKESQSAVQRLWDSHSKMLQFCTSKILSGAWQEASECEGEDSGRIAE